MTIKPWRLSAVGGKPDMAFPPFPESRGRGERFRPCSLRRLSGVSSGGKVSLRFSPMHMPMSARLMPYKQSGFPSVEHFPSLKTYGGVLSSVKLVLLESSLSAPSLGYVV